MGSFIQLVVLILCFVYVLMVSKASRDVMHVRVTNQLEKGLNLSLHCKSKDDDLGIHVLQNQEFYEWSFRNNIWGTTRFYCYLQSLRRSNSFDVYRQGMCSAHCNWFVRPEGTCLETQKPYRSFCYPWPSNEATRVVGGEVEEGGVEDGRTMDN
ncbi:hypothetical protein U1Q18_004850 [Sarracenia purpurea var. burkii]